MNVYERDGQYLVVLGHIPQWLIVDEFALGIVKDIESGMGLKEIRCQYSVSQQDDVLETYDDLLPLVRQEINRDSPVVERALTSKTTVAMIAVTRKCNLQFVCPHCYIDAGGPRTKELSCEEHAGLANQIRECLTPDPTKTYKVNLTGGEPFFHRKIIRIIMSYWEVGLEVNMSTNAMLIKDSDIPALAEMGVVLSVSLDGATPDTHDKIRGRGAWEKVRSKIRQLTSNGIKIDINCLLHTGNLFELERMVEQAHDLGCSGFNPINLVQLGRACNSPLRRVSEMEVFKHLAKYLVRHPEQRHLFDFSSLFSSLGAAISTGITCESCGVGNRPCVYIDETGSVYPCPNMQKEEFLLGNIRQCPLSDCVKMDHSVLTRLRSLQVSNLNAKCSSCDVRFFCGGDCRGETYNVTGDLTAPYVACEDRHDSIIELMWVIAEHPELFENRAEEYMVNLR